jgi:hypothetical protein
VIMGHCYLNMEVDKGETEVILFVITEIIA